MQSTSKSENIQVLGVSFQIFSGTRQMTELPNSVQSGEVLTLSFSPSLSHTSKKYLVKSSSDNGTPFTRIRSRTATRCGDVNRPA